MPAAPHRPVRHGPQAGAPRSPAFPGYQPGAKTIAAHPILADMAALSVKTVPNPWREHDPGRPGGHDRGRQEPDATRSRSFTVKAGEPIKLTFVNPDVVPHNWVLISPARCRRSATW